MILKAHLSRAERLARLGVLLSKGVSLMLAREADAKPTPLLTMAPGSAPTRDLKCELQGDAAELAIIQYLARVGTASPRDIQFGLSLPKATAYRRLDRLVKAGDIVRLGKTTASRYCLFRPSANVNTKL